MLGATDLALAFNEKDAGFPIVDCAGIHADAILLKRDRANLAPAEEAFLAAIAIGQTQKARSFELQAALALAKLYQSAGRLAEAHAVLAPALEGFSPTSEMPAIAEAQVLMKRLA